MATTIGTLKYRMAQVKNPQKPSEAQKWYARAVQDRTVAFEDFVTHTGRAQLALLARRHPRRTHRHARLPAGIGAGRKVGTPGRTGSVLPRAFRDGAQRNARTGTPHSWTAFT